LAGALTSQRLTPFSRTPFERGTISTRSDLLFQNHDRSNTMAEGGSGGSNGVLGVLVGALIVIVVGGGILYATGTIGGHKSTTLKVEMPKIETPKSN
jgi:hypothetical protein